MYIKAFVNVALLFYLGAFMKISQVLTALTLTLGLAK